MKTKQLLIQFLALMLMGLAVPNSVKAQYSLYVGEQVFIPTPDAPYNGWIETAFFNRDSHIAIVEQDEAGAIIYPSHYFEGTETITCVYTFGYYVGTTLRAGNSQKTFYITCKKVTGRLSEEQLNMTIGQKKKLDTIHEYLLYIMSPFVYEEDMDEFCTDLLRFAMDHNYRPEAEWKKFKTKLSSFDVRHLVWSIATRLGLGKGKVYSNDDCACYIERRFASLCVTANGDPLSHSTLRNLTVTSNSDQIHCDIQGADGLLFHIPSQLGIEKD